jgi:hypothetical protein
MPSVPEHAVAARIVTASGPRPLGKRIANLVFTRDSEYPAGVQFRAQCEVILDSGVAKDVEDIIAVEGPVSDPVKRNKAKKSLKDAAAAATPTFADIVDLAVENQKDKPKPGQDKRVATFEFIRHSKSPKEVEVRIMCEVTLPETLSKQIEDIVMKAGAIPQAEIIKAQGLLKPSLPASMTKGFEDILGLALANQRDK